MKSIQMFKNKKVMIAIIIAILIVSIIFFLFFMKKVNKNNNFGNTMSNKTMQEIEETILNIRSYDAKIAVIVESNKNKNQYVITQKYVSPNLEKQIVEEPSNIKGLEMTYDGKQLKIVNTQIGAQTIYENYPYLTNNFLWLNSFIQEYKEEKQKGNTKLLEKENRIILQVQGQGKNPYIYDKELQIDKATGQITKMVVQDKNKKNLVYILYNEIKINSLKEEILAFQIQNVDSYQF